MENEFTRKTIREFLGNNKIQNLDYVKTKKTLEDVFAKPNFIYKTDVIKDNIDNLKNILFELRMHSLSSIRDGNILLDKNKMLVGKVKEMIE